MHRIRVLLADDHTLVRVGIRKLLDGIEDIEVVGEAADGEEAVQLAHTLHPDVVLMDISMPRCDGIEATRRIKDDLPDVKVLILTMHEDESFIPRVLEVGSLGYMLKSANPDELIHAIRGVYRGKIYLASFVSKRVLKEYMGWHTKRDADSEDPQLTPQEQRVFVLVKDGLDNKGIADRMCLSPRTVENHKRHIARKLGLQSARELTRAYRVLRV